MDEAKLNQIKTYLAEEEELVDQLKKNPNLSTEIAPQLNTLYRKRVELERSEWGCGVPRGKWQSLKTSLLQEATLEERKNNGNTSDEERDIERLLQIIKKQREIFLDDLESSINHSIACPLLPEGKSVSSISAHIREKSQSIVDKQQKGKGEEKEREHDIKRRDLIRLFMSPQFS